MRANGTRRELTEDAMLRLRSYEWPGNIRQLLHVLRYCTHFAEDGLIGVDLVEDGIRNQQIVANGRSVELAKSPKPKSDEDMKRELAETLEATGGNKSEAARLIGIHRSTVYRRLERDGAGGGA